MDNFIRIAILVVVNGLLALIPAHYARQRGYRYASYWLLSFFLTFTVGLIVVFSNPDKRLPAVCAQCGKALISKMQKCPECGADAPPPMYTEQPMETPFYPRSAFVGNWLGILLMVIALAGVLILGFPREPFVSFLADGFAGMLMPAAAIAMGIVLTARAKGPDFSLPVLMTLSGAVAAKIISAGGAPAAGIAAALVVCVLIGALSSIMIMLLRLPSLIVTIISGFAVTIINFFVIWGRAIALDGVSGFGKEFEAADTVAIALICAMLLTAFAMVRFSRLGVPMHAEVKPKGRHAVFFASYMVAALFAGIAGIFTTMRIGFAVKDGNELMSIGLWFILLALTSSRQIDNKWAPALWAMLAAVVFTLIRLALNLYRVHAVWINIFYYIWMIPFLITSLKANRDALKRMGRFG